MRSDDKKMCLNVPELAQELGISKPMAYELVNCAGFPSFRVGKRIIVSREALEEWLRNASASEKCRRLMNSDKRTLC